MVFDPVVAQVRFGAGLSPRHALPQSMQALLDDLTGADAMAVAHVIPQLARAAPTPQDYAAAFQARRDAKGTAQAPAAQDRLVALGQAVRAARQRDGVRTVARSLDAPIGFRERLVAFWADHFTVKSRAGHTRHYVSPYVEEAIRPHIAGRFSDMLRAAEMHPMMLTYLQQARSVGPNSDYGLRQGRGLNENLAREMLELHTLGVAGGYNQRDVTQLAELLSGLTYTPAKGVHFDPRRAEPGDETVLGETYAAAPSPVVIEEALDDLARHPATAEHLARKLAVHFVTDDPAPDLIAAIADAYRATDGQLLACYEAMLAHPAAWDPTPQKVRPPLDFILAGLRALAVTGAEIVALKGNDVVQLLERPLRVMGQPWQDPPGPDGWPERAEDWVIPQAVAGRITWAMRAPPLLRDPLPDPRDVVTAALGPNADPAVVFAARSASTRAEGVGVIFASAAFQRR